VPTSDHISSHAARSPRRLATSSARPLSTSTCAEGIWAHPGGGTWGQSRALFDVPGCRGGDGRATPAPSRDSPWRASPYRRWVASPQAMDRRRARPTARAAHAPQDTPGSESVAGLQAPDHGGRSRFHGKRGRAALGSSWLSSLRLGCLFLCERGAEPQLCNTFGHPYGPKVNTWLPRLPDALSCGVKFSRTINPILFVCSCDCVFGKILFVR
jgi:hypothetical protein